MLELLDVLADLAGDLTDASLGPGFDLVTGRPLRPAPELEGGMASAEPGKP